MPGVMYIVEVQMTLTFAAAAPIVYPIGTYRRRGPISKGRQGTLEGFFYGTNPRQFEGLHTVNDPQANSNQINITLFRVRREDGQPDTGGNPIGDPEPIPASQPNRSPLGVGAPSPSVVPSSSPASGAAPAPAVAPPAVAPGTAPAEPGEGTEPGGSPFKLPGLGGLPIPIPAIGKAPGGSPANTADPTGQKQPGGKPPSSPPQTPPGGCGTRCSLGLSQNQQTIINNQNTIVNGLGLGADAAELGLLAVINAKLGPQVPGGLSGFLGKFQDFVKKAWENTKVDKALNALNTLLLLHNAAMLSRSLASSLGELASQALTVFGVKDAEGGAIDVNEIVGGSITQIAKNVLGESLFTRVTQSWAKVNNIITSASNVVWTVRGLADSSREIAEWTAENTGKIGNALKKWRVVGENAYKWMPERINAQSKWEQRIRKAQEGVEEIDSAASSLSGVLGEVQSIQSELGELNEQKAAFTTAIASATPKDRADNTPVKTAVDASNASSAGQNPAPGDSRRGDEL
jgi:hypothetical protein